MLVELGFRTKTSNLILLSWVYDLGVQVAILMLRFLITFEIINYYYYYYYYYY